MTRQFNPVGHETQFPAQSLPRNLQPMDPFFGGFMGALRAAIEPGSSEFGLGLSLFSLAVSINARCMVEIGRFRGFSTFALASALRFLEIGWDEPEHHCTRPDVDYVALSLPCRRELYSVDPVPLPEAEQLLAAHDLTRFVTLANARSDSLFLTRQFDLAFVDGDHSYPAVRADVEKYATRGLRPGGYLVLHDYFGWYNANDENCSPIKRVVDELQATGMYESLLVDTFFQSFVILRKR
jgi:predicted O-methyltransferase YrrM